MKKKPKAVPKAAKTSSTRPEISNRDKSVLRRLAEQHAEIAAMPIHEQTEEAWRNLNALRPSGRPLIFINEIPWHEMNVNDELTLLCENELCRQAEWQLRSTIYQWEHMRGDMVVEPIFRTPVMINSTGFGLHEEARILKTDAGNSVVSRKFHPQIVGPKDIEKILTPQITVDENLTLLNRAILMDIFEDRLEVESYGVGPIWFAPWDELVRWWGVEEALTDLVMRPEMVHAAMDRLTNAYIGMLEQYEQINVLSLNNGNCRIGSGGLGYSGELPQKDFNPGHVTTQDQWGCATAQIFSEVSPEMHWEFALQYELRWLNRFGMTYYGCCEPLHNKLEILKSVPNLRKVSMSPWVDADKAVRHMKDKYVYSLKPNPALLAMDSWNLDQARKSLKDALEKPIKAGCVVEVILKDISTVRHEPHRLWQWAEMARQVAEELSPC